MDPESWIDVGAEHELRQKHVQQVFLGHKKIAMVQKDDHCSAISGVCNVPGTPGHGTFSAVTEGIQLTVGLAEKHRIQSKCRVSASAGAHPDPLGEGRHPSVVRTDRCGNLAAVGKMAGVDGSSGYRP